MLPQDTSSGRPSFFEVYAAQHLNGTLRPAVRFALDVLAVRHRRLRFFANWSDELFSLIMLLLESVQLRRYSCLLSESFFGLRRTSSLNFAPVSPQRERLSRIQIGLALLFDVVFSYARAKADASHSSLTGGAAAPLFEDDQMSINHEPHAVRDSFSVPRRQALVRLIRSTFTRIRRLRREDIVSSFVKLYPKLRSTVDGCNILLNLLYLYGHSRFFSLSLLLQRLCLRRGSHQDVMNLTLSNRLRRPSFRSDTLTALADGFLNILRTTFIASIFAFRFLQYYYATEVCPSLKQSSHYNAPTDLIFVTFYLMIASRIRPHALALQITSHLALEKPDP